jgi:CheY-like chemotaxis protein/anti-sigma regulatory factor (Ser/Thr protein kinase)
MGSAPKRGGRVLLVDDDRAIRLALRTLLAGSGHTVTEAADGVAALAALDRAPVDVMLLDVGLPGLNGLDVLSEVRALPSPPRVIVITADDTPETLLQAVRRQAYRYVTKPFAPAAMVEIVQEVLSAPADSPPIEVVSARPEWVELVAPCTFEAADRLQAFLMQLESNLPEQTRESVGQAFRELLCNAIEWGGKLDPSRKVRISCLRGRRMLLYRIADPGEGFDIAGLTHSAICNPDDSPLQHAVVREEKGLRPGGLGLALTRALVDELIYNEARNEVVLIKYLD